MNLDYLDKKVNKFLEEGREQTPEGYFCDMYRHYRNSKTSPDEAAEQALAHFDHEDERKIAERFAGVKYWQLAWGGKFEDDSHFIR